MKINKAGFDFCLCWENSIFVSAYKTDVEKQLQWLALIYLATKSTLPPSKKKQNK